MQRLASWILPVTLLAGCAVAPVVHDVPGIEKSEAMTVIDERPAEENELKVFSYSVFSEAYGLYRRPDNALSPPALRLLKHRLHERLDQGGSMPAVTIRHFVIYENAQSELRGGAAAGALGGIIGGAIAGAMAPSPGEIRHTEITPAVFNETAGESEYKRAWFTPEEQSSRKTAVMLYINTVAGDREVFTRTMAPVTQPDGKRRTFLEIANAAIDYHVSRY